MGFGTPVALLIGIILILVAVGLFFLDKFKPGYKRDSDTVYAVLFLTVGIMSLVNWSQNFLESFQLMILAGMLIALVLESIQRRTAQSKQVGTIYRDEERERPSRGSYRSREEESPRAELRVELDDDRFTPIDEFSRPRRIRGTGGGTRDNGLQDPYAARSDEWNDNDSYADQLTENTRSSRRSSRRPSGYDDESQYTSAPEGQGRSSRRRPLQLEGDAKDSYSDPYVTGTESSSRRRGSGSQSTDSSLPEDSFASSSSRSRRRRPRSNNGDRPTDETYVDYKPIKPSDYPGDDEFDNSNNFDDGPKFN